jgi:predicted Fe-Mo cluster-binding NifX family protein
MKTIITALEANTDSEIDLRFGRCAYLCLYDHDDGQITFIRNEFKDARGGAGTQVAEKVISMGAGRIVSGDFGPKAKELLDKFNIQLVKIQDEKKTIKEIVSSFK